MASRLADAASPYLRAHADNPVDVVPLGAGGLRRGGAARCPAPGLDRLLDLPLVPCDGARVVLRSADRARAERRLRRDQGRPRGASGGRRRVPRRRLRLHPAPRLAAHRVRHPEGRAFFAGTYLPPRAPGGVPAFRQVLAAVRRHGRDRRDELLSHRRMRSRDALAATARPIGRRARTPTLARLAEAAALRGGARGPRVRRIRTRRVRRNRRRSSRPFRRCVSCRRWLSPMPVPDAAAVAVRRRSPAMAVSPLRDRVDGGFFRYATAARLDGPALRAHAHRQRAALEVAIDAGAVDVAARCGGLPPRGAAAPRRRIRAPHRTPSHGSTGAQRGRILRRVRPTRAGLAAPAVDGKVVTGWNGLAIAALARAGRRLGGPRWIEARALGGRRGTGDQRPRRRAPRPSIPRRGRLAPSATLEDYGLLARGSPRSPRRPGRSPMPFAPGSWWMPASRATPSPPRRVAVTPS